MTSDHPIDRNRLARYAIECMGYMPDGYADALATLELIRRLVEWRESGKSPARVVRLVSDDAPPAA